MTVSLVIFLRWYSLVIFLRWYSPFLFGPSSMETEDCLKDTGLVMCVMEKCDVGVYGGALMAVFFPWAFAFSLKLFPLSFAYNLLVVD